MTTKSRISRSLAVAAFVALTGPPIGSLGFLVALGLANGWSGDGAADLDVSEIARAFAVFVLFGYVIGGFQALMSAAWLGLRTYRKGGFGYREAVLTSAIATVCVALGWAFGRDSEPFFGALLLIVIAVPSALVVRWLLRWTGWLDGS